MTKNLVSLPDRELLRYALPELLSWLFEFSGYLIQQKPVKGFGRQAMAGNRPVLVVTKMERRTIRLGGNLAEKRPASPGEESVRPLRTPRDAGWEPLNRDLTLARLGW